MTAWFRPAAVPGSAAGVLVRRAPDTWRQSPFLAQAREAASTQCNFRFGPEQRAGTGCVGWHLLVSDVFTCILLGTGRLFNLYISIHPWVWISVGRTVGPGWAVQLLCMVSLGCAGISLQLLF